MSSETISIRISNAAFFFWFSDLEILAEEHGIEPTRRQASKFKNKKGRLWGVYGKGSLKSKSEDKL